MDILSNIGLSEITSYYNILQVEIYLTTEMLLATRTINILLGLIIVWGANSSFNKPQYNAATAWTFYFYTSSLLECLQSQTDFLPNFPLTFMSP